MGRLSRSTRATLAVVIALALSYASWAVWNRPDVFIAQTPDWRTAAWWITPIEQNRVLRPSPESLNSLFFLPDGQRGWAVGDNGTILTTGNGGQTSRKPQRSAMD